MGRIGPDRTDGESERLRLSIYPPSLDRLGTSFNTSYLKPYAFLAERVYKFSERRKFSCIRHRSSGVAERLRANRIISSSLRLLSSRSRRFLMAWNFLLFTGEFYGRLVATAIMKPGGEYLPWLLPNR